MGNEDADPTKFIGDLVQRYGHMTEAPCDKIIVIPWGAKGAYCLELSDPENVIFCKAYKPAQVVDTLGAGDTFNGAFLFAFRQGWQLRVCCDFAARCAGFKVGRRGIDCLRDFAVLASKLKTRCHGWCGLFLNWLDFYDPTHVIPTKNARHTCDTNLTCPCFKFNKQRPAQKHGHAECEEQVGCEMKSDCAQMTILGFMASVSALP